MTIDQTTATILNSYIDHYAHVNHARYQDIFEDAQKIFLEKRDADFQDAETKYDIRFVQRAFSIEFKRPLYLNDEIVVETMISTIGTTSFVFSQKIIKQNVLVTEATTVYVAIGCDDAKVNLPTGFRSKLEK